MAALLNAIDATKFDLLATLGRKFGTIFTTIGAFVEHSRKRTAYNQLMSLDDHMLDDLGLERSGIQAAVYGNKSR